MPVKTKPEPVQSAKMSTVLSMLSGWARQGTESFFATQKILLDLVMRQNANTMHAIRERMDAAKTVSAEALTEVGGEGYASFIDAQRILLHLAQSESEIVLGAVKERVGGVVAIGAATDLVRRGVDNYIEMQQHFLTMASRQTDAWIDARRSDSAFDGKSLAELAQEGIENFVRSQKKFLDIVAEEAEVMLAGKANSNGAAKGAKKTELAELARQGAEAFIDAQKKLLDVATQQMSIDMRMAGKAMKEVNPFAPDTMVDLTRQTVDNLVTAQKALLEVMRKPAPAPASKDAAEPKAKAAPRKRRPVAVTV